MRREIWKCKVVCLHDYRFKIKEGISGALPTQILRPRKWRYIQRTLCCLACVDEQMATVINYGT